MQRLPQAADLFLLQFLPLENNAQRLLTLENSAQRLLLRTMNAFQRRRILSRRYGVSNWLPRDHACLRGRCRPPCPPLHQRRR